jgi:Uncharacterized membrane protein (homolog of Drosophila rhomboid)
VFRQRSGSSLCYACGKLNRVDASVCFYCGRRNPGLWGFGAGIGRLIGGLDFAGLVTVVSAGRLSRLPCPRSAGGHRSPWCLHLLAPSGRALYALGMAGAIPWQQGHWWTVLTAIYLHGSLLHILFNLLWVRQLVPEVEQVYGRARTVIIFTVSGVTCFLVSNFAGTPFTVGASGAVFGLLSAMVWYGRRRGGLFGSAVLRQYGTWAIVLFVLGFLSGTSVNNWGHAGGLIGGFLAAFVFAPTHERPEQGTDRVLAGAVLALTAAAFGLQLWVTFVG